jgi:hypothetical protein
MKLKEITENGSAYLIAEQIVSKNKYRKLFSQSSETSKYAEIPLNDHATESRSTRLPYDKEINILIQRAIDMGAELLWIKKGR